MKTLAVIQARLGSSRLPGKVMEPILDRPMLAWVVARARRAAAVDAVVVATTAEAGDDALAAWCRENDILVHRGSTFDVLDRVYQAARQQGAERVVRLTADCPLIDPLEIDHVCGEMLAREVDFCANRLPPPWTRSYPIGLDTEVVTMAALERAWREA
ncbi:MAG: NTP transferase domain-containing protein, partial [Anaerolineae bacterium]|nr:NTP transferase domain-containing protein [Anaerolineae bacterium]